MAIRRRFGHVWTRLQRYEFTTLLLILGVPVALLVFAELAEEVGEGDTRTFDRAVLLGLRTARNLSDPIGPLWLEKAAIDVTSLGSITVLALVSLAAIGFLLVVRKRAAALLVLVSVGGGQLLSSLLKEVFERPRPDLVPHVVQIVTASFPSGHAMLSAVTYLTLGTLLARVQPLRRVKVYLFAVAVLLTLLIGVSRVYLGVHWPTDVLAGWCVGAAWAMLCWLVAVWLQRRGQVEGDAREGTAATDA